MLRRLISLPITILSPHQSAHIDGVASEFVVHSGHSAQEAPQAIEEVRRILVENLKD